MRFVKLFDVMINWLKKVMLVCKILWMWVLEGVVEVDEYFMGVKFVFEEKGVVFEVDCDEVEEEEKWVKRDVLVY